MFQNVETESKQTLNQNDSPLHCQSVPLSLQNSNGNFKSAEGKLVTELFPCFVGKPFINIKF